VDDTIQATLSKLNERGIISAPVLEGDRAIGMVDVLDLLAGLIKTAEKPLTDLYSGESRSLKSDDIQMLAKRTKDFNLGTVRDVVDLSKRNPYVPINANATLREAINLMSEKSLHRVCLVDDSGKTVGVLTQADIARFLTERHLLPEARPVKELGSMKTRKLNMTTTSTRVIDSYMQMHREQLSALAVVNEAGVLCEVLSASDLKGMIGEGFDFRRLLDSVQDFLISVRAKQRKGANFAAVACQPSDTIAESVQRMMTEQVHRVFVVDKKNRPVAAVSFTDLLHEFDIRG